MTKNQNNFILRRLKNNKLCFGDQLRMVTAVIPRLEVVTCVRAIKKLLEFALASRPSNEELYELCEASERSELIHEYLRGFFLQDGSDPRRLEMAQRLEGIISYRITQNEARKQDRKLRQTLAEYLLRARN